MAMVVAVGRPWPVAWNVEVRLCARRVVMGASSHSSGCKER